MRFIPLPEVDMLTVDDCSIFVILMLISIFGHDSINYFSLESLAVVGSFQKALILLCLGLVPVHWSTER